MATVAKKQLNLPDPVNTWVDEQGRPTIELAQFMSALSRHVTGPYVVAASDAAAAKAGVPIHGVYDNPTTGLQVRKV